MKETLNESLKVAGEKVSEAWPVATEAIHQIGDAATRGRQQMESTIRRHPWEFLAASFGVGCLIGALMGRK